jgi:Tfp pilus assembly protein PilO
VTTKISDTTNVQMPMKTVISLIALVGMGVYSYFIIQERLNRLETSEQLVKKDLQTSVASLKLDIDKNTTFRIDRPQSPAVKEAFMLIEHISGQLEKLTAKVEDRSNNSVNITRLQTDMMEVRSAVEKLKDAQRHLQINGK